MFISARRQPTSKAGFTLIELLLVTALLPIVFYAVFSNFSMGTRVWKTVNMATPIEDLAIFFQKARADFENTFNNQAIPFEGERDSVSFASTVSTMPELGGERGIGRVKLFYDSSEKAIARQAWDYSELYRESEGKKTLLLRDVSSLEFSYLTKEVDSESTEWTGSWKPEPDKLPLAVRLTFAVGNGEITERTFFLPAGGGADVAK